jgi:uncharacterized OB-fold protein
VSPTELPPVDDITTGWWDATRDGTLYLQTCRACGGVQHHPRALCLRCGRTDQLGWARASGVATIDTWTVVHRAPAPDVEVPYVVARVRLAEGPVLLTNLVDVSADELAIGRAVRLAWRALPDGRQLPVFTLAPSDREGR